MGTYITQTDLEARLSEATVRDILDDDADGYVDDDPLERVIADAESYVEGFLRVAYDLETIRALGTDVPNEVKRLCLDIATAYLWERHPEYVRADGDKLLMRARLELVDLRRGLTRLDIEGAPEPPANRGGETRSGDAEYPDPVNFYKNPTDFGIF